MEIIKAIGVDPASGDYQCALIQEGKKKVINKTFSVKSDSLTDFIYWVEKEKVRIIAIEGQGTPALPYSDSFLQ